MNIKSIKLENYTVFEKLSLDFNKGINVFIGENATGKTHLMKLLYAACKSNRANTGFEEKIVRTMMPDEFRISRLVTRTAGNRHAKVKILASQNEQKAERQLSIEFARNIKKWKAIVKGKEGWEKAFAEDSSVFIPAKEILSHSYKLAAATSVDNVRFDDTYIDIINLAKIDISVGKNPTLRSGLLKKIERITGGKIQYDEKKDEFYLKQGNSKQEFNLVAEGIKKMGLLWQLAKNGTLESGSVLFWDEPEANINPANLSLVAELLLELQRNGVQIFISTHNYFLAKYLDIKKTDQDDVSFYSFYYGAEEQGVQCEINDQFTLLENNPITKTYLQIYRDELGVVL
ncbi:MAG: AAA family ATPase [Eubacteriales bacterium]|nr:AAA family ATPase [Eubacteriales bacterium]